MKEGWEYNSLGIVCKIYNGNSINADYKKTHYMGLSEGYPFIATKDVSFDGIINYKNGVRIPFDEGLKVAKPSSVFICVEGGSAGRKIGLVDREVCFGNKLFCLESKGSVLGSFIYYYLKSGLFQEQFAERLTGLIGGVSAKKFNDISIIYPPLSEQQRIVDYLDSAFANIDAMKANAEKSLNEAKALFQASLKEMLEPKEGWEEKTLKEITSEIGDGLHGTPKYSDDGNYFFVNGNNFENGLIEIKDNTKRIGLEEYEKYKIDLNTSTVLLSINGTIGKTAFYDGEPIILGKSACYINVLPALLKEYLRYFLLSDFFVIYAKKNARQATIVNLGLKELRNMPIPLPPLSEQQSIVATLDSLKSKVDRLQANFEKISQECDALKQAILRQVFE